MIAEILCILAGHTSSILQDGVPSATLDSLLHPGERDCLIFFGRVSKYCRFIKAAVRYSKPADGTRSPFIASLYARIDAILRERYDTLVIDTEAKILSQDAALVSSGSKVPLSAIHAIFSEWERPLAQIHQLVLDVQANQRKWTAGPLIDLLESRAQTAYHNVAEIMSSLSQAVQRVWRQHLVAFLIHGSLIPQFPLADPENGYSLHNNAIPSCVSESARESIRYIGKAVIQTKKQREIPHELATEQIRALESALPSDQHGFDRVLANLRSAIGEWLWLNVLTPLEVYSALETLANYFLCRSGEFTLSLIREIERLKLTRLTSRAGLIRDQDLNLAFLRASVGTSAEHDSTLSLVRFELLEGPMRPLLPSLTPALNHDESQATNKKHTFNNSLLGSPMTLSYKIEWPLDLLLQSTDMTIYSELFAFLSALRRIHTRVMDCWIALSNSQRNRRRWTGLGEGGTSEDTRLRQQLLRFGWGTVREMAWFLDVIVSYVMVDVIDSEFKKLHEQLVSGLEDAQKDGKGFKLDFSSVRGLHAVYLYRLNVASLMADVRAASLLKSIFELCDRLVAHVDRWGGDILPDLLSEGSISIGGEESVGAMVRERWETCSEIKEAFRTQLEDFHDHLAMSMSQPTTNVDASRSMVFNSMMLDQTSVRHTNMHFRESERDVRKYMERLLLKIDYNGRFSDSAARSSGGILREGGLA